ncbi:hypothetical protein ACFQ0K_15920 [Nocardioides caeni]|uniref:Uncharacterized protein n=1 Tax=Nocardioides caeni TaxID=574700 RepID=A0A4S8N0T9_9ACTN|nr:hypothetical protein [Nocardioides caeni]THV09383.1 hypothetical protein E9934_15685 [Nocardioides caeni]
MDRREARRVLGQRVEELRQLSFEALRDTWLDSPDCEKVQAPDGKGYQIEIEAVWDSEADGHLRMLCSIDDGGLSALMPMSDGFIKASDESFVGE